MEFKLNKIDTDLRLKLQEKRDDHKVHGKEGTTIEAYNEEKEKFREDKKFAKILEEKKKTKKEKKIIIDGVMVDNLQVEGEKDVSEISKGVFIDIKK
ncbi:hypothetical protein [Clostridium intestinale]|uniref:hypothetical protein n=1 Tax=Clostridium intestinale TaxID=36845 RepID=UPI002DD6424A|nr:hypothetical protein [Clostridium intestinale]WRY53852.1 hypothetical protein P8F83_11715 [Clostridium intestinale]